MGIMSSGVDTRLRVFGLDDSQQLKNADLIELCSSARVGRVIYSGRNQISVVDWKGQDFAVKSFGIPWGPRQLIYGCLRASKAKRSFQNAQTLLTLGFFTPQPVGYLEMGGRYRLRRSFYVSAYATGPSGGLCPLRDILLDHSWPDRTRILSDFGRYTYLLHEKGVCHRDYSPGNILVSQLFSNEKSQAGSSNSFLYRFDLVDLNRMSFGSMSLKKRMQSFRQLWAEDSDLEIIVHAYARAGHKCPQNLFRLAVNASQQHKRKANLEEWCKRKLRMFFRTRRSERKSDSSIHLKTP